MKTNNLITFFIAVIAIAIVISPFLCDTAIAEVNNKSKKNLGLKEKQKQQIDLLISKGDLKGAEAILKKALVLNPYPSKIHYRLGVIYEVLKDYKKAIKHFKKALKKHR